MRDAAAKERALLGQRDAESLRHAVQRPAIDAENLGRAGAIAVGGLEHVQQIPALEVVEGRQIGKRLVSRDRKHGRDGFGQLERLDQDVYIDGFFAGFVNDFDGVLQYLPATPGDHAITLYKEGYRTITRHVVVTSDATATLRLKMDRLEQDRTSEPPPAPVLRSDSWRRLAN